MRFAYLFTAVVAAGLAACVQSPPTGYATPVTLSEQTGFAVDRLMAGATPGGVPRNMTILVASLADLRGSEIRQTSNFGRLVSEQISEHLVQQGYRVPEVRLAGSILLKDSGEFVLSRQLQDLRRSHNAELAIASTFTSIGPRTYVNLKLIRLADAMAIGASDFEWRRIGDY